MLTPYQTKYLAYELTKRLPADKAEKLSQSLCNATVDLNPHQVEAALFAFRSPLSRGAILADEVGLGKTIEAGLIVSQLWAERKRRILCVLPAALRKQWNRELVEKFFLESLILETKNFKQLQKQGLANPFLQPDRVVLCSYQFARARIADLQAVPWDLIVLDEAHRLRNVYKKSNKIARALLDAIGTRPKILLTATPLQNSLMELFGLVMFIDPHVFGSEESFREQFAKRTDNAGSGQYKELKARIQPICQRTLRRQVIEYVRYTKRLSITQDFTPTAEEQKLYQQVSEYLQKPELFALPSSQRKLITLVLRKILASSSFAIGETLGTMVSRLQKRTKPTAEAADAGVAQVVGTDLEHVDELEDEWAESDDEGDVAKDGESKMTDAELLKAISEEVSELNNYRTLAESIQTNAKGEALLTALKTGFQKADQLGAPRKALIFTESRRTQAYLKSLLEANGYAGQLVIFNGTNADPESKRVYKDWLTRHAGEECVTGSQTADMRSALVDEFSDRAAIMIATESAAEGVNLQFCNLVVNYDLPWNPQRIEQRIGRCHRYGQKHDVVVINFLNRANEADQRVFEILNEKFRLFDGVFGASDEVLGALESGVDFEKRISQIYQTCRSSSEIHAAFDQLQKELDAEIQGSLRDARTKLLENFDDDVQRKLRLRSTELKQQLGRFGELLWHLTRTELADNASFDRAGYRFHLKSVPAEFTADYIPLGSYRLVTERGDNGDHHFRMGHPLAQRLLHRAKTRPLPVREVLFDYTRYEGKLSVVEPLRGRSGWLRVMQLSVSALETEDHVLCCGVTDDGQVLDCDVCNKLLLVPGQVGREAVLPEDASAALDGAMKAERQRALDDAMHRNQRYFDAEMQKLDRWADDLKENLEREIKELAAQISAAKREALQAASLAEKLECRKKQAELEKSRNAKRRSLFDAQDRIENEKDQLIANIEAQLKQVVTEEEVFTLRWQVV